MTSSVRPPRSNLSGQKLKNIREKLGLKYRDVAEASQRIASQESNPEFAIGLSRLADIENKGTLPSIYRLYSLGVIYGMDYSQLCAIFGVSLLKMPADSLRMAFANTREARFEPSGKATVDVPLNLEAPLDPRYTTYLSRQLHRWGKLSAVLLHSVDLRKQRYAFIGTDDWSMHPLIRPGSFVQIDETKRQIKNDLPASVSEKPIYFLEHRKGFRCAWCTLSEGWLIAQSHMASGVPPEIYKFPGDVDVVGQVVGVAMRLEPEKRRRKGS